jgi:hypothetical protein
MESELGRYFEGRRLETTMLLKQVHDLALGTGRDVTVWIDGRELVFGRGAPRRGRGFLRVVPGEVQLVLAFPRGHELFDPKQRARGPRGSQTQLTIGHAIDLDPYVRRMIDSAYALDR